MLKKIAFAAATVMIAATATAGAADAGYKRHYGYHGHKVHYGYVTYGYKKHHHHHHNHYVYGWRKAYKPVYWSYGYRYKTW